MRTLQVLLVIVMMTLSITGVVAQKTVFNLTDGVVYITSYFPEKRIVWWIIFALIGIISMIVAQRSNNRVVVIFAFATAIASIFVIIIGSNSKIFYIYSISMIIYIIAMYFAF